MTALRNYDGKSIELPDKFQPYEDFLAYHRERIYSWETAKKKAPPFEEGT